MAQASMQGQSHKEEGEMAIHGKTIGNHGKTLGKWWFNGILWDLPSGYVKIAIENGHRNSEMSHQ